MMSHRFFFLLYQEDKNTAVTCHLARLYSKISNQFVPGQNTKNRKQSVHSYWKDLRGISGTFTLLVPGIFLHSYFTRTNILWYLDHDHQHDIRHFYLHRVHAEQQNYNCIFRVAYPTPMLPKMLLGSWKWASNISHVQRKVLRTFLLRQD
jgi:hypothetical protein